MHATVRSYEGIDKTRAAELSTKVNETLLPLLRKLPGFSGYYLLETGDGAMSSIGFFETSQQIEESTRVAEAWVRDEKLETVLPNAPKITTGEVLVHTNGFIRA
jgi:hypothetical protein